MEKSTTNTAAFMRLHHCLAPAYWPAVVFILPGISVNLPAVPSPVAAGVISG